jgi:hypothetical protein
LPLGLDVGFLAEKHVAVQGELEAIIGVRWAGADWEVKGTDLVVCGVSVSKVARVEGGYLGGRWWLAYDWITQRKRSFGMHAQML